MDHEAFLKLLDAYQQGQASAEEKELVETHFASYLKNHPQLPEANRMQQAKKRGWQMLAQRFEHPKKMVTFTLRSTYRIATIAALCVVAFAVSLYFYHRLNVNHPDKNLNIMGATVHAPRPGGNKATLTLANGTKVDLDSAQSGIIIKNESVLYTDGTSLSAGKDVGVSHFGEGRGRSADFKELKLTTPKGGQYQIILSDGTKVWLNAASTLKYPSRFSGGKREVFLDGEGYFEIRNAEIPGGGKAMPFIVRSKNQLITVLGTSFNLAAYVDEPSVRTTLVSGTVQVSLLSKSTEAPHGHKQLHPGQQTVVKGDSLLVRKIDVNSQIAWKSGFFNFKNKTLAEALQEIGRWYDLEVVYPEGVPAIEFWGELGRDLSFDLVLKALKQAGVHYSLAPGRKLIIYKHRIP